MVLIGRESLRKIILFFKILNILKCCYFFVKFSYNGLLRKNNMFLVQFFDTKIFVRLVDWYVWSLYFQLIAKFSTAVLIY